jgi:hypothetical protein
VVPARRRLPPGQPTENGFAVATRLQGMTWERLFERARRYEVSERDVAETLAERRDG